MKKFIIVATSTILFACGGTEITDPGGLGGSVGPFEPAGGSVAVGGSNDGSGASVASTGGATVQTGGSPGTGGVVEATGGALSTGGDVGTGGFEATGGDPGTGGDVGTGGASTGGAPPVPDECSPPISTEAGHMVQTCGNFCGWGSSVPGTNWAPPQECWNVDYFTQECIVTALDSVIDMVVMTPGFGNDSSGGNPNVCSPRSSYVATGLGALAGTMSLYGNGMCAKVESPFDGWTINSVDLNTLKRTTTQNCQIVKAAMAPQKTYIEVYHLGNDSSWLTAKVVPCSETCD